MRTHPHLYEINTWPWLDALSRQAGRRVTIGGIRDAEWDRLERCGFDIVYLSLKSPSARRLAAPVAP
jgi:hypothetical protein